MCNLKKLQMKGDDFMTLKQLIDFVEEHPKLETDKIEIVVIHNDQFFGIETMGLSEEYCYLNLGGYCI